MIFAGILFFLVWIYLIHVAKKAELKFLNFIIGSVGIFIFMMIWIRPIITGPLTWLVATVSGTLGDMTGFFDAYPDYGMLFIPKDTVAVSLYIDFECSGVIEIMAFLSMLLFFNVYNFYEKIFVSIIGVIWIFISNVLRLLVITAFIYWFGNDIFFFAHVIVGRIVFYFLSIVLYFYVFTRSQVIRQKVGRVMYQKKKNDDIKVKH